MGKPVHKDFSPFDHLPFKDFAPVIHKDLDPNWASKAACLGMGATPAGIERWFPNPGGNSAPGIAVCKQCSVTRECWNFAEENNLDSGVFGGKMRPRRTKQPEQG